MNWYLKKLFAGFNVLAGSRDDYLRSIDADENIIAFINSVPDQTLAQQYVNMFRQNPTITLEQLQSSIQVPEQQVDPYTNQEYALANTYASFIDHDKEIVKKWILVNLRKVRKGRNVPGLSKAPGISPELHDLSYFYSFAFGKMNNDVLPRSIGDWYNAVNPDISSITFDQAIDASDTWHRAMAAGGEGLEYEPTNPGLIVYGPKWENEDFNGWTIQRIMSENDLKTEGNKLNHCIGSYCKEVERESTIVYSLRDPQNEPHASINTSDSAGNEVEQIFGHSNSEPKDLYKRMIREWIMSGETGPEYQNSDTDEKDVLESIDTIGSKEETNEYGLVLMNEDPNLEDMDYLLRETLKEAKELQNRWGRSSQGGDYWGDITYYPEKVVDAAIRLGPMSLRQLEDSLSDVSQEAEEELEDSGYYYEHDESMPDEADFETSEEYDEAYKEYEKNYQIGYDYWREDVDKWLPHGFIHDMYKYVAELREDGKIPSYDDLHKKQLVASNKKMNWYE